MPACSSSGNRRVFFVSRSVDLGTFAPLSDTRCNPLQSVPADWCRSDAAPSRRQQLVPMPLYEKQLVAPASTIFEAPLQPLELAGRRA